MNVRVCPTAVLKGSVQLPPSKSYSVRAFITAACGGRSCIIHPSLCDDALAAAGAAECLGARIVRRGNQWEVTAGAGRERLSRIDIRESGTVLRMLLPLVALKERPACVTGRGTLRGRPNHHLIRTLRALGVDVCGQGPEHAVPISFQGGRIRSGTVSIDGSMSSQFVSALLMACPMLAGDSILRITGKTIVSAEYITMTLQILERAGIRIQSLSRRVYTIPGGQTYTGLKRFVVPSDYGLAAFLMAAAVLTGSDICLKGTLDDHFVQADARIIPILEQMGCSFIRTSRSIRVRAPRVLKGGVFSLRDSPDLLPVLSVLALFADRPVTFRDIAHARVKESDRISDLRAELVKTGARVEESRGTLKVYPLKETDCQQAPVFDPRRDHRLAMAFCVLGLRIGAQVKTVECVAKSYPGFLDDLRALGAGIAVRGGAGKGPGAASG